MMIRDCVTCVYFVESRVHSFSLSTLCGCWVVPLHITLGTLLIGPHPKPIPPLILSTCGVINVLQYSLACPLHDAMSKVHKYSVYGVCTTNGARGPASPLLGPAHCHTATVAHIVALTPRLKELGCRARNEDVLEALDRLSSAQCDPEL